MLTAASWTFDSLAHAVNIAGAEAGMRLRYDRTAVAHWLSGTHPQGQVPALIAEVLTRRLGRVVTLFEVGLGHADADSVQRGRIDGTAALAELILTDLDPVGHNLLARSTYQLDTLVVPPWPGSTRQFRPGIQRRFRPKGPGHQAHIAQHIVGVFAATNHRFGSGHIRNALTAYLAHDILPQLGTSGSETTERELLSAATDLTLLIGFVCFDSNEHGLAQRYYRATLELAVLSGDPIRYAIVLRALSQQACYLGHGAPALRLAFAALTAANGIAPQHTNAFLHAQVSLCYATLGDHHSALAHYQSARDSLSLAVGPPPTFGSYHQGELAYHAASIRAFDGDTSGAITALRTALRHYPTAERRSRVLTLGTLAERQLDLGQLAYACATAYRFLDNYPHVCSGRASTALYALHERLQQFRDHPAARKLLRHASTL
ncbi:tol-pal system YbgF family protein [Amycolatopsis sp. NPDC059657]|uniref:tetratricopeptide repeat protein n=1 Tax=Amycolatopsis sp. NPDC059657 TaxID=3346899 RepID=UPI003671E8AB